MKCLSYQSTARPTRTRTFSRTLTLNARASRHSSTRGRASTTLHTHNGVCLRWYGVGGEPLGSSGERRARAPAGTSPTAHPGPREGTRDASIAFGGSRRRREPARADLAGDDRCETSGDVAFSAPWYSLHCDPRLARVGPSRDAPRRPLRARPQRLPSPSHVLESPLTLYPLLLPMAGSRARSRGVRGEG